MLLSCATMEVALLFSDLYHYGFDKVSVCVSVCVCVWYNLGYEPCIIQRESIILSGIRNQHRLPKTASDQ